MLTSAVNATATRTACQPDQQSHLRLVGHTSWLNTPKFSHAFFLQNKTEKMNHAIRKKSLYSNGIFIIEIQPNFRIIHKF